MKKGFWVRAFFTLPLLMFLINNPLLVQAKKPPHPLHPKPKFFVTCWADGAQYFGLPPCDDDGNKFIPPPVAGCGNSQTDLSDKDVYDSKGVLLGVVHLYGSNLTVGCGSMWEGYRAMGSECSYILAERIIEQNGDKSVTYGTDGNDYRVCNTWESTYMAGTGSGECAAANIHVLDQWGVTIVEFTPNFCM